jgi:BNR repeat-like domain
MLSVALLLALRLAPQTPDVPLKQPQIAASGQTVALAYGAGNSIYFARSENGGKSFSTPVKVAEATKLALGSHRGPRIALAGKTIVISAIKFGEGDLMSWRSGDGGKTWSQGVRINDVPTSAREGLHGMAASPDGKVWTVWLDLREKATRLVGSMSNDGGKTWSTNQQIYTSPDGHICECCHPTAYIGPKGELYAMWRNSLSGSRDMYYAVSRDRKTWKAQKLGTGTWPLNACPMDGGGLAIDAKGAVYTAWRRDGGIYATTGQDAEVALGKGKNPAITAGKDGRYIVWTEGMNVMLSKPGVPQPIDLGMGAFPVVAGSGPIYAAWEHDGSITVEQVQ